MTSREDLALLVRCVMKGSASIVPIMDGLIEIRIDGARWQTFRDGDGTPEIGPGIRQALEASECLLPPSERPKPPPYAAPRIDVTA